MKTWEKVMLFTKPAIAMLVAVTMMLSLMPLTAVAAGTHRHPVCGDSSCTEPTHAVSNNWTEWNGNTNITYNKNTASVYLSSDVALNAPLNVAAGKTLNLCLNGHTLSYNGSNTAISGIFTVERNGVLNLCSCTNGGKIQRTSKSSNIPLIYARNNARVNLYNVTLDGGAKWTGSNDTVLGRGTNNSQGITTSAPLIDAGYQKITGGHIALYDGVFLQNNSCSETGHGGAITIGEDGSLVISGAVIRKNGKTNGQAGATKAYAGARITLLSGEIYGNQAVTHGGAIQIFGDDSTDHQYVSFTMSGGTIRNNKAGRVGGAIAVSNFSEFNMSGGEIKNNATTDQDKRGGGVGFADLDTKMSISGNAIITGNTAKGDANNLYVGSNNNNKVKIGQMTSSARVGVTRAGGTGIFTSGGANYADKNYFVSDKSNYAVVSDGSDNLKLVLHTHTCTYDVNTDNPAQIIESCACGHRETATIELDSKVSTVYNGTQIKPLKVTYSKDWVGDKNAEISYSNNIDAGIETANGFVIIAGKTATKNFTITKKNADSPTPPTAQNSITYGAKLSEVGLSATWTWLDGNIVPTVQNNGYVAYYTPTDTANYDWTQVEGWNAVTGRVERTISVTVDKATPEYTVPANVTATYGDTLANVTISGTGWTWKEPTTNVGNVGAKTFVAIFTPADTDNYKTVEVDVTVTVGKANSTYTAPTAKQNLVYNGGEISPVDGGSSENGTMMYAVGSDATTAPTSGWSADIPEVRNAGTYYIWYKVVGDNNHNDVAPACIPVTIAKAPLTVTANNKTITYGDAPANDGVTYSGFVPNENADVLGGTLDYDYSYAQYGNVNDYDITPKGLTSDNYEITFVKGTLTVQKKELGIVWSNTALTYNGTAQKPTATATGTINDDQISLTVDGAMTDASATAYTATVTAISGEKATNYKLPDSVTTDFTIGKADQAAPAVSKANETIFGKTDGMLTDVTEAMEYRAESESTYTAITGNTVENLAAGKYYVRVKGDNNHNVSPDTTVTIASGRKLTVTLPQNQVGYTLTVDKTEFEYMGGPKITLQIADGYSKTSNFAVKINGTDMHWGDYTEIGTQNFKEDIVITVEGVVDTTAPAAEITIKDNKWTSFWNDLTFGLLFNETQDVTIAATDAGSGIKDIEYYLASGELKLDEVRAITDWESYNGTFKIAPNNRYVVYAKVTDNAGNTLYINSDGIILDNVAPTLEGIENGQTYYGDLTILKPEGELIITLDGKEMEFVEDTYGLIPADNAEHIIVVEDHAGNKTTYIVTVMKKYTITFMDENGVYMTLTYKHGETVTMPDVPKKDGYTVKWETTIDKATGDATIKAVYTKNPTIDTPGSPQTGDHSNLWLWVAVLFVSGGCLFGIALIKRKRKAANKK